MIVKRTMNVVVNLKDGGTLNFEGDQAQAVLQQFEKRRLGQTDHNQFFYTDEEGNNQGLEWHCVCGYTQLPTTEEEIPGRECDPMDCIEPIVRPVNPTNVVATPTTDGAAITVDAVEGAQLIVLKAGQEIATGEIGVGEVTISGLTSGTNVATGEYKLIWRGPVRDSYRVDVPSFTVETEED